MKKSTVPFLLLLFLTAIAVQAFERSDEAFKVFQFPPEHIPHIDGKTTDWDMVGEEYTYRTDQLDGTEGGYADGIVKPEDLDISVKVGWVKGLNRLYFLYEAYDDYWDFERFDARRSYQNDIFEISLDADISGGQFIHNAQIEDPVENYFRFSGAHAQNYHIFTPPVNQQWCMVWGGNPWIAWFPWAHQAYDYGFKPGEAGKLVLEFWVTPFDYAPYDGPERAVTSKLVENQVIGLSWAVLDFDNGKKDGKGNSTLAGHRMSVQDASYLCAFRLMPIEKDLLPAIDSRFSFKIIDMDRRLVYFKDESIGNITKWTWHFGDGETSNEQNPIHKYDKSSYKHNVLLEVEGPDGVSRFSRHREVLIK